MPAVAAGSRPSLAEPQLTRPNDSPAPQPPLLKQIAAKQSTAKQQKQPSRTVAHVTADSTAAACAHARPTALDRVQPGRAAAETSSLRGSDGWAPKTATTEGDMLDRDDAPTRCAGSPEAKVVEEDGLAGINPPARYLTTCCVVLCCAVL